jgi:hypothetical protein
MIKVQFVQPAHQLQILGRNWPRHVVDRAPRDAQRLRLSDHWKCMIAVNHLFALNNPAFVSAPDKKSWGWPR